MSKALEDYKIAVSYMKDLGIDPKGNDFLYINVYLGYSMMRKRAKMNFDLPDTPYMSKMLDHGLVDSKRQITEKGENMLKDVNPDFYKGILEFDNLKS